MKKMKLKAPFFIFLVVLFTAAVYQFKKMGTVYAILPAKTFSMRLTAEPATLDWNRAHTMVETYLLMNLMEGLVTFDDEMKVVPRLAESFQQSKDGKKITFKLRKDVKWSDGVPLKAEDFLYSWKRLLTPKTAASYAYFLYDILGAEEFNKGKITDFNSVGIKVLPDNILEVTLKQPVAHWMSIPTFWVTFPLRQDIIEKHGEKWTKPGNMVTIGPFVLFKHDVENKIILRKNLNYWGESGNIEEVVGQIVKDDSTALTLYETGKLDFLGDLPTTDLARLKKSSDLKVFPYLKTGYLGFSVNVEPVNQVKLRQAIAYAIDKSKLSNILHGHQEIGKSFVPPRLLAHSEKIGIPFNPDKAKTLLAEAGIDPKKIPKIELLSASWEKSMTLAQFIQSELKKNIGLNVSIQSYDHKAFRAQLKLNKFAMFTGSWSADYPDPDNFLSLWTSDSGNNRTNWKSRVYDQWVTDARYNTQKELRLKKYTDAQKILIETDAVVIPLFYEPNLALVKSRVKGLTINPLNYLLLRKVNLGS